MSLDINKDFVPNRGKIEAMMNDKPFIRLQMKKPCDHLFMRPLFQAILNVGPNCLVKKGKYNLNIDIQEVATKYYGGMFIYGNLSFKSVFYNDECNLSCTVIEVNFSPKNNKTSN
ncbi:uncharacterized protein LOC116768473 [Danaus plexippus]|uniref:uncharacterized protein LOC116768473 n=1 Tax=Danaus plexippus TaxID=13037 RepID=UPI002AB0B457|nr:uncharacterized protein LOC116768473 [Danaus plexippus]